jgi:hypothetical protein
MKKAVVLLVFLSGCGTYFAPTLAEFQQPIWDPAQCSRYYNSIVAPSWFNSLFFSASSGIQDNVPHLAIMAYNGGSTGTLNQNIYESCNRKARTNGYQGN